MEDCRRANLTVTADFHVGEAASYLKKEKGYRVIARYKPSEDSPKEEAATVSGTVSSPETQSFALRPPR